MPPSIKLDGLKGYMKNLARRKSDCKGSFVKVDRHGNVIPCCNWPKLDYDKYVGRCSSCPTLINVEDDGMTEFSCQGCAVWPYVDVYCSENCQAKGSEKHTPEVCADQKNKKRAFALLDDLTRIFLENTFIHKCTGINVRDGMTTLTWSMPDVWYEDLRGFTGGSILLDFPAEVMPPDASDTALSLAQHANCGAEKIFWDLCQHVFDDYTEDLVPEDFRIHGIAKIGHLRIAGKSVGMHLASCSDYVMKFEQADGHDMEWITGQVCPGEHFLRHSDGCQPTACNILLPDGETVQDMYSDYLWFVKLKSIYRSQELIVDNLAKDYIDPIEAWIGRHNDLAGIIELPDADFNEARRELVNYATKILLESKQSLREADGGRLLLGENGELLVTNKAMETIDFIKAAWLEEDDELVKTGDVEKLWEEYKRRTELHAITWHSWPTYADITADEQSRGEEVRGEDEEIPEEAENEEQPQGSEEEPARGDERLSKDTQ